MGDIANFFSVFGFKGTLVAIFILIVFFLVLYVVASKTKKKFNFEFGPFKFKSDSDTQNKIDKIKTLIELNKDSSRSHSILTVYLISETENKEDNHIFKKYGKISFVDLAGSERLKES